VEIHARWKGEGTEEVQVMGADCSFRTFKIQRERERLYEEGEGLSFCLLVYYIVLIFI